MSTVGGTQTQGSAPISLTKPVFNEVELEAARRPLEAGVLPGHEVQRFKPAVAPFTAGRHALAAAG